MIGPGDSLAPPAKASPLKAIGVGALILGLAAGGWWMFGRGKGQAENPARVLIVAPTMELGEFLEGEGFEVTLLSAPEAIGEGQRFDSGLEDLPAMVEYADHSGIGYLALDMAHGEQYDFASAGYPDEPAPPGTTFAVLSVGDLGQTLHYGAVVAEVHHDKPAGEKVGLLFGLFAHEALAKAKTREAANDLMIRFGSAGTVEHLLDYEKGQENMRRQIAAWDQALGDPQSILELGRAYEPVAPWPLANGKLLLASQPESWHSRDGRSTEWDGERGSYAMHLLDPEGNFAAREPCTELPQLSWDTQVTMGAGGDALLVPATSHIADLWVLDGEGCRFEQHGQIRRLEGWELGEPHPSGRTAAIVDQRLNWADAKMRAYQTLNVPGLRPHGKLGWLDGETLMMAATLDFDELARARAELDAPVDPSLALPDNVDALLIVKLPPLTKAAPLRGAIVPVDALGGSRDERIGELYVLDPSEGAPGLELALRTEGSAQRLLRVSLGAQPELWHELSAEDFDLLRAMKPPAEAVQTTVLVDALPAEAASFVLNRGATLLAWSTSLEPDPSKAEIFTLSLTEATATATRRTEDALPDLSPQFVGDKLVFLTEVEAAEGLPAVRTVRALPL